MTDMSAEPTDWWLDSMPNYSPRREAYAPSVESDPGSDISRWTTITAQEPYEDSCATSATSPSEPSNSTPEPLVEQANTSPGLPLINLPDPKKFAEWVAKTRPDNWEPKMTIFPSEEY